MTTFELTFITSRWGNILKMTHSNNDKWKDDMILILSAMRAYTTATREDPKLQPVDVNHDEKDDDWKPEEAEAVSVIRRSYTPKVRGIVTGIQNPHEMWNTPETFMDTTIFYVGWQDILGQFHACQPMEDNPLHAHFTKLRNYCIQVVYTYDAITNQDFHMQLFTSLTSQYAMILMVLKHSRPLPRPEEAMHNVLEKETTVSLTNELGEASTWADHFSKHRGYRGQGHGRGGHRECSGLSGLSVLSGHSGRSGHSGCSGTGDSFESMCTGCNIFHHSTDACGKWRCTPPGGNNVEHICFQCGLPGHVKVNYISYKCIKKWWNVMKVTAIAALATTGDCDHWWLTACTFTATAAVAPMRVFESGASYYISNDHSRFWTFKILSLPIEIELEDHDSVTTMYSGLVDVIQGFHVEDLHRWTFWPSPPPINQLDLGEHMIIFLNRKCSITSPCYCSLAGKLINSMYIMVSLNTLLSLTTEYKNSRQIDSSPTIEPTNEL